MRKRKISVAGLQILHQEATREANLERAAAMIQRAPGHDLYVLPELSSCGYGKVAFEALDQLAEEMDGPSFKTFSKLAKAHNCFISYGYPRCNPGGKPTISNAVVNRKGELVAHYDKWHVCQSGDAFEKRYFDAGQAPLETFSVGDVRVGVCICYDIRFPELVRKLALEQGIHLLLHPGGWPRDEGFHSWHPFVFTRAVENAIYIMSVNRASRDNGHSVFYPPYPDFKTTSPIMLEEVDAEGVLTGDVDLDHLADIRQKYCLQTDRRPDMYGT